MAIQPRQQPQSQGGLQKLLPVAGAVAGGVLGGGSPGAIATGASLGQTAAGLTAQAPTQPVESQGMARRQEMIGTDPMTLIRQTQAAIQTLPPDQLPETRRALNQAMQFLEADRKV